MQNTSNIILCNSSFSTGDQYFDAVLCGPLQGLYAHHVHWFRGEYNKAGMFLISGEPNKGKTALSKTALSLCSNRDFLFSYKVSNSVNPSFLNVCCCFLYNIFTPQSSTAWISTICEKTSLLVVLGMLGFFSF